ncbi:DUF2127 domain-containing protein [Gloeobacter kilaueensis]|uniref:DUF2127 domain-containing protein n=1 Tax=Gloeobacter kilaueensis (strain ATCC BAA-2537 / CCAP 1431/1 / ULC 316 / JS1) TaxID=1183438 RepID=U5QKY5_GLOK1|nr:DUF2127 domain-containing protein [Gloeobacter kilaueensis]AGY59538.1 hypothetical protein GKIL_3292 [Gloeobacter kilaueensis JS1]
MTTVANRPLGTFLIALHKLIWGVVLVFLALGVEVLRFKGINQPIQFVLSELGISARSHIWTLLVGLLPSVDGTQLKRVGVFLFVYSAVTLIEGWGVWEGKRWVEIFLVLETAALLPVELVELVKKFSFGKVALLLINLFVVVYLGWSLWRKWQQEKKKDRPAQ